MISHDDIIKHRLPSAGYSYADRSVCTSGHALCDFHGPVLVEKLNIQNCNDKRTQIKAKDLNSSYGKNPKP